MGAHRCCWLSTGVLVEDASVVSAIEDRERRRKRRDYDARKNKKDFERYVAPKNVQRILDEITGQIEPVSRKRLD